MIEVVHAATLPDRRADISRVFATAFADDFRSIHRDPAVLAAAFAHALVLEHVWVSMIDGEVAAVATLTGDTQTPLRHEPRVFRQHLGAVKGRVASLVFRRWFEEVRSDLGERAREIGFVGTAPEHRGRGAARALMEHLLAVPGIESFLLEEIKDTNEAALGLYRSLGFVEHRRKPARFSTGAGFSAYVSMRLDRDEPGSTRPA